MPRTRYTIDQIPGLLAATPRRIAEITDGLTAAQLRMSPGDDEWSTNEVLAHLRACADCWGESIMTIIAEDHPTIRAVNPRTWIKRTDYLELEFGRSLQAFAAQRARLMSALESLTSDGWSRSATVTGAGKVLERTVLTYAEKLARHERPHIEQIAHIASALRAE